MSKLKKVLETQRGFSLVTVLVGAGIAGVVALGISTLIVGSFKQSRVLAIQQSRDQLTHSTYTFLANAVALGKSSLLPQNREFTKCFTGSLPADPCKAKNPAGTYLQHALVLVSPTGLEVIGAGNGRPADRSGSECGTKTIEEFGARFPSCPIRVFTHFKAICPGDTAECLRAESFEFSYLIQKNDDASDDLLFKPSSGIATFTLTTPGTEPTVAASTSAGSISCFGIKTVGNCCVNFGSQVRCFDIQSGAPSGATMNINLGKWTRKNSALYSSFSKNVPPLNCPYVEPNGQSCNDLNAECNTTENNGSPQMAVVTYTCKE